MRSCEIISVGTELLLGNIVDTNQSFLSQKLAEIGIPVYFRQSCGDNFERLKETFLIAYNRSDIVIMTGGLGPTYDDITKKAVASALKKELVFDQNSFERIKEYFRLRNREMPEENITQAFFPEGAEIIDNDCGTAPGIHISENGKDVFMMPGVPFEMKEMFSKKVMPLISDGFGITSINLNFYGISESKLDEVLNDIMTSSKNPTVAPYAKTGEVLIRITSLGKDENERKEKCIDTAKEILSRVGEFCYAVNGESLENVLVKRFSERKLSIAFAESMTGGLCAERVTSVSGASSVIGSSYVTYSEESKEKEVGVKKETLDNFSVYSAETAVEMARGARKRAGVSVGVGITGVAGPTGGTEKAPVGTCYIAVSTETEDKVESCIFKSTREITRYLAASKAFQMALKATDLFEFDPKSL